MTEHFVICDHGVIEASLVPDTLLGRPGFSPDGVYDTLLVNDGQPVDWEPHWARLLSGCKFIGANAEPLSMLVTPEAVSELTRKNGLERGRSRLRIEIFRREQVIASGEKIQFLAAVWPVKAEVIPSGLIALGQTRREQGDISYNQKLLGRRDIEAEMEDTLRRGYCDIVFLNNKSEMCEGGYSNLWLITGDTLLTPPLDAPCLPGITRAKLISKARNLGIHVIDDKPLPMTELHTADGMFLTSSIRGMQPVGVIENIRSFEAIAAVEKMRTLLADSNLSG